MPATQVKIGLVERSQHCVEALLDLYRIPYEILEEWSAAQLQGYEAIIIPPRATLSEIALHSLQQVNQELGVGLVKIGDPQYSEDAKVLKTLWDLFGIAPRLGIPKLERKGGEIHFVRDHPIVLKEFVTEPVYSNLPVSLVSMRRGQILGYILDEMQDEWPAVVVAQHGAGKCVWVNHGIGGTEYPGGKMGILFRELLHASMLWTSRAGILPRLNFWPKDYRCAYLLTVDLEEDKDYRAGLTEKSHVRTHTTRILDLLAKHKIKGTWNTCGEIAEKYPDLLKIVKKHSHEIAGHTYRHEYLPFLTYAEEKAVLERMIRTISESIEEPITGFRAPRMYLSENTPVILTELGFKWDSSARSTYDLPYVLKDYEKILGLVELPEIGSMDWKLFSFLGYSSEEGANVLREEFTKTYEKGTMFLHILHPWQIAVQDYLIALDTFLSHVTGFTGVWACPCRELVAWWKKRQKIELNWNFINAQECQISIINNSDQRIENLGILIDKSDNFQTNKLQIRSEKPIEWKLTSRKDSTRIYIILYELKSHEMIEVTVNFEKG